MQLQKRFTHLQLLPQPVALLTQRVQQLVVPPAGLCVNRVCFALDVICV